MLVPAVSGNGGNCIKVGRSFMDNVSFGKNGHSWNFQLQRESALLPGSVKATHDMSMSAACQRHDTAPNPPHGPPPMACIIG